MKYVLAKDLPFAKAGKDVMFLYTGSRTVVECYLNASDGVTFKIGGEEMIESLINEGWVKEVKPREFYVELKQWVDGTWRVNDVSEHKEDLVHINHNALYRIIKTVEVLE